MEDRHVRPPPHERLSAMVELLRDPDGHPIFVVGKAPDMKPKASTEGAVLPPKPLIERDPDGNGLWAESAQK